MIGKYNGFTALSLSHFLAPSTWAQGVQELKFWIQELGMYEAYLRKTMYFHDLWTFSNEWEGP